MAVEITQDVTRYTWASNGYTFATYQETWGGAAKTSSSINVTENLLVKEKSNRKIKAYQSETFGINELFKRGAVRKFIESFGLKDSHNTKSAFCLSIAETMGFIYSDNIMQGRPFREEVSLLDLKKLAINKEVPESFDFAEAFNLKAVTTRSPVENFGLQDRFGSSRYRRFTESFGISDCLFRASEGVMSDIHLTNKTFDYDEFLEIAKVPALYNPFVEFRVGEYEYKNAMVKVRFHTTAKESSPSLTNCVMHVDIPDTDDKGTVDIIDTTALTKVYYNKNYYTPPEVVVVLRGGNSLDGTLTPNVASTDKMDSEGRYFEVELLDAYGNRKTGKIGWVAKGY